MLRLEAERIVAGTVNTMPGAESGRALLAPLVPATPTRMFPFEPPVSINGTDPRLLIWATGDAAWRGAEVQVLEGGQERALGFATAGVATGRLLEPLLPGAETVWDEKTALVLDGGQFSEGFQSRSEADVLAGANLMLVDRELLQFRTAEQVGAGTVRLTGLLRGRYGTASGAAVGQDVVAVPVGSAPDFAIGPDVVGRDLILLAAGRGDPAGGTELVYKVDGSGLAPLAPVHLRCERDPGGSIRCSWISRHRENWAWGSNEDPPPPAFSWRYAGDDSTVRTVRVTGLSLALSAAQQQALFGGILAAGSVAVEAIGEGPAAVRISRSVRV